MRSRPPLTELAQRAVGEVVRPGDRVVDATIGNGNDTLFLARRVAPGGHVIGFDIQREALANTRARLSSAGLERDATLLQCGHQHMSEQVPPDWRGRVAVVMFNLGYLPGSDKRHITRADTTVSALRQALALLQLGGLISLMVYRGHAGSADEADSVRAWLEQLAASFRVSSHESPGPLLHLVRRMR